MSNTLAMESVLMLYFRCVAQGLCHSVIGCSTILQHEDTSQPRGNLPFHALKMKLTFITSVALTAVLDRPPWRSAGLSKCAVPKRPGSFAHREEKLPFAWPLCPSAVKRARAPRVLVDHSGEPHHADWLQGTWLHSTSPRPAQAMNPSISTPLNEGQPAHYAVLQC